MSKGGTGGKGEGGRRGGKMRREEEEARGK